MNAGESCTGKHSPAGSGYVHHPATRSTPHQLDSSNPHSTTTFWEMAGRIIGSHYIQCAPALWTWMDEWSD